MEHNCFMQLRRSSTSAQKMRYLDLRWVLFITKKNSTVPFGKGKGLPQQAKVARGVPGRLRPRIFLTFGTTRVVGYHPYAPAAFIPEEIPGTHF